MNLIALHGKRRVVVRIVVLICVAFVVALACGPCIATYIQVGMAYQARDRLLCQTDYQVLLNACRDLLKRQEPGVYAVGDRPRSPVVLQFPKPILELAPEFILIEDDGHMVIDMFGNGMYHCGAFVYPEGFRGSTRGNRMLREGLWYYDDEYNDDPRYDTVIDKLIRKKKDN